MYNWIRGNVDKYREILIRNYRTKKEPETTVEYSTWNWKYSRRGLPDSPIFKTLPSTARGMGSIFDLWTKFSACCTVWPKKKEEERKFFCLFVCFKYNKESQQDGGEVKKNVEYISPWMHQEYLRGRSCHRAQTIIGKSPDLLERNI